MQNSAKKLVEKQEDAVKLEKQLDDLVEKGQISRKQADEFAEHLDEIIDDTYKYFDKIGASKRLFKELRQLENIYKKGSKVTFEKNVAYLNDSERAPYEIFIQHDKIVNNKGKLFETTGSVEINIGGEAIISNKAIYVMSEKGEIYISKSSEYGKFHHSSFLSGENVAAAGDIIIEKGIIKEISNSSGHYRPNFESVKKNMLDEISNRGYFSIGINNKEDIIFNRGF